MHRTALSKTKQKELLRRLLCPNPAMRLGMLKDGSLGVLRHPVCKHIDIAELEARRLPPPFVPSVRDALDLSNFDNGQGRSGGDPAEASDRAHEREEATGRAPAVTSGDSVSDSAFSTNILHACK